MNAFHTSAFFFFNDTATTEIYTLSLHDALPISNAFDANKGSYQDVGGTVAELAGSGTIPSGDRKSTRLNSSHSQISYAVFCLKKKKINKRSYANLETRGCSSKLSISCGFTGTGR